MTLPAVNRALFANRSQIQLFISEVLRNLSLSSRFNFKTQSLQCLKTVTSQSNAVTVHRRSQLYRRICESNGDENSRATSNWTYAMWSAIGK